MRKIIAKVTLDNRIAIIVSHPESIEWLAKMFTVLDTSECWQGGKFKKELAKPICFITQSPNDPTGAMIPIGLVNTLEIILKKAKAAYKVFDERKEENFSFTDEHIAHILENENNPIVLRDYQIDAVKKMLSVKNGTIKAATGAGKTELIAAWCKLTGKKTIIAFKNIKLAREIVTRMKKANIDIGLVQGTLVNEDHQVVAITIQSAHKLNRFDYEAVIVDESHNSSQGRYQDFLKKYDFAYRFGFSATPFNKKNKLKTYKCKSWLGDTIYEKGAKELIDEGHLAKPKITFIEVNRVINHVKRQKAEKLFDKQGEPIEYDFPHNNFWFGNEKVDDNGKIIKHTRYWYEEQEKTIEDDAPWTSVERSGIVSNIYRNKMIKALANTLPGTVLALVKYVESHGEKLHKVIDNSLFLSGQNKIKERELAVEMLEANELKAIIASTIFDEGIDLKRVNNVILVGGGQSYEKTLQRIGRGMRKHTDENGKVKTEVRVFDFYDKTHPTLERHSKARMQYMLDEGYEVIIKKLNL